MVAIQLGIAGALLLFAMWLSHFLLFRVEGLAGWVGMAVVAQNFIGSLFNNHLTDFTQSWIYMFGVGVAGAHGAEGNRDRRVKAKRLDVSARLDLPAQPRILVIALRRLGDVLLTTPLIRSLRRAWPDATIEVLVFADTAAILDGNPDIDGIVTCPERPSAVRELRAR